MLSGRHRQGLRSSLTDGVSRQDSPPGSAGIDDRIAADDRTGAEDGVATDLGTVPDNRPKFFEPGVQLTLGSIDDDRLMIEPDIGEDRPRSQVSLVTEDGIADVIKVGDLRLVEDQAVLEFAGIAQHNPIANHNILTDVGAVADLASLADPCRPLDHGTMLDHGAAPDEDSSADEGFADQLPKDAWLEAELKVGSDLGERLPRVGDVLENDAVLGTVEVKEIVWSEHGEKNDGGRRSDK